MCKNCNIVNLSNFADSSEANLSNAADNTKALGFYRRSSELKNLEDYEGAEKGFLEILNLNINSNLKGKVYFQLGLLKLEDARYKNSLNFMKLAVGHYFSHGMAFTYLYLLFVFLENPKISSNFRHENETYMEQISRANGLVCTFF